MSSMLAETCRSGNQDPRHAGQVLFTNAAAYSKGILSEILEFVMGQGLIPANGEVWKTRRRTIVPSLHK